VFVNLAGAHLATGDLEGALGAADRAVALAPGIAQAQGTRGLVLSRLGRHAEALAALELAVETDPTRSTLQADLARAYLEAERPREALAACLRLSDLAPSALAGPLCAGEALLRLGRAEEARAELARARALAPQHPDVRELARRIAEDGV
jgi:tetratricopeptide (TPR) repeat protein